MYREALESIEKSPDSSMVPKKRVVEIGQMYISELLAKGVFFYAEKGEEAAVQCVKTFKDDTVLWGSGITQFMACNSLYHIVPYIPFASPELSRETYHAVLDAIISDGNMDVWCVIRSC
jgi:hypothetical protein